MRNKLKILIYCLVLFLTACTKNNLYEGDHFFVENAGASMPVYVKGNINSNIFVIFLHGGPGSNSTQAAFLPVFQDLQNSYAIAYWDQRGSGLSQGNPDKSSFTVAQFVEDLDMVVEAIRLRYDQPKIFLYGISWGGALGCAYLTNTTLQNKITGFINMDSGHNLVAGLPLSVAWMGNFAQTQIDANIDTTYWKEVRDWCANTPDMTIPENYFHYAAILPKTNASRHNPNQIVQNASIDGEVVMNSFMSLAIFFNGGYVASNFNILELNLTPQLHLIQTPTMVLWGRHDGINTVDMAYDAYTAIGGSSFIDKELVILEHSAHEGYLEEQDSFLFHVRSFVEKYK